MLLLTQTVLAVIAMTCTAAFVSKGIGIIIKMLFLNYQLDAHCQMYHALSHTCLFFFFSFFLIWSIRLKIIPERYDQC